MPSCVLRVFGERFDVDGFLAQSGWNACAVWHRGEQPLKSRPPEPTAGCNFTVSATSSLQEQVEDAIAFLKERQTRLCGLRDWPDIDGRVLDFEVYRRDEILVFRYRFPVRLLALAAKMEIELAVSEYPRSTDA